MTALENPLPASAAPDDDLKLLAEDAASSEAQIFGEPWKILVVDDNEDVHATTRLALTGLTFKNRPVQTLHASNGLQAQAIVLQHPDIALALADIVMETEHAGLKLVRWIREAADNQLMRIVMRTGQAADIPEETVVREFDIDDFRQKTDLRLITLRTLVMSHLRAWDNLCTLEAHRRDLDKLVQTRTQELDAARMRLVQTDRMASLGQLAAGMAHSLNTPLGYLASNLGALNAALPTLQKALNSIAEHEISADLPELIQECRAGVEDIQRTVKNLTLFAQPETADERQWADLNEGIAATLALLQPQLKVAIVADLQPLPDIECHPSRINMVLMQLVNNAARAMQGLPGRIHVQSGATQSSVWFTVRDEGCGMSDAVRARVFEPFFTTCDVGQGSGLGLSLVWGIVRDHNGTVDVQSMQGAGSTFTVALPRQKDSIKT